jgi:hypothetical protein
VKTSCCKNRFFLPIAGVKVQQKPATCVCALNAFVESRTFEVSMINQKMPDIQPGIFSLQKSIFKN